ncbi:putative inactive purple acid phosphatase 28 [Turnera subulata]|uniref:Inactive purple acid phosphatase 28 n=1 Tax=Turnera subulata TaxID=218843 RepID=A0A9Q0FKH8_9ROSI|nr:putative inactive purple acid phosphatase 28 [Turnera subulata]
MGSSAAKWGYSLLYLTLILSILFSFHTQIAHKLLLGHHKLRLKRSPHLPLRFRHDGTFKILQVADMHFGTGLVTRCRDVLSSEFHYCTDLNTTRFLRRMIQSEKPDFVAFTGDNIFGTSTPDAAESMIRAFAPVMDAGIPWAAVLGNHDQESSMTRQELMSFLSLMDYSVSQTNPSVVDAGGLMMTAGIDGFGNYDLRVYGAPGSELANTSALNLYFLDSGDREIVQGIRTYGWIRESQLHWLRGVSKQNQGQTELLSHLSQGSTPALAFFHIPIPEIRQLYNHKVVGQFQEAVACSLVNSGVLQTFVSMGDVKAVFMGHDHNNDFCGNLEGIWLCYGGGFGYHGYGRAGWPRRARVILAELGKGEKSWLGVQRIETWKRLDDEDLTVIDEQSRNGTGEMAATDDEEIDSLLSSFDHIYQDFKSGIQEIQSLRSNLNAEVKNRESLHITCSSLKQENERLRMLYTDSLNNLAHELERRTICHSLKEELKRARDEHHTTVDEHRKAMELLRHEYAIKIADMESQISKTKHVEQRQDLTSNRLVETLKVKIMKLRKENEILKRKFSQ